MTTNNTYPQHIQDFANKMIAKGAKISFEAICEMQMKKDGKMAKKQNSTKEANKWGQRNLVENTVASANASVWLSEKNRENAMKSLPSSMR